MSKASQTLLSAALILFPTAPLLAQSPIPIPDYVTAPGADKVLVNAPYSAQRHFTSVRTLSDGNTSSDDSNGTDARDSQGRTYDAGERHWTYVKDQKNVLGTEMLYRVEDPIANTETRWDSTSKQAKVIHWSVPAATSKVEDCACSDNTLILLGAVIEKLGTKTIEGLVVEGTRMSYSATVDREHKDKPTVVVKETWYSPDLKIVILSTNNDPGHVGSKDELTDIVRGEPDISKYRPPADYVIRKIEVPQ